MRELASLGFMALTFLPAYKLPSDVLGTWKVERPYDVGPRHPIGLDARQERSIVDSSFHLSPSLLTVCGKDVPIRTIHVGRLTKRAFLRKYGVNAAQIGLIANSILEIDINDLHSSNACGEFADPGSHLLVGENHVVVEIANAYFSLRKQDAN